MRACLLVINNLRKTNARGLKSADFVVYLNSLPDYFHNQAVFLSI